LKISLSRVSKKSKSRKRRKREGRGKGGEVRILALVAFPLSPYPVSLADPPFPLNLTQSASFLPCHPFLPYHLPLCALPVAIPFAQSLLPYPSRKKKCTHVSSGTVHGLVSRIDVHGFLNGGLRK
jgi:hypothetical protein